MHSTPLPKILYIDDEEWNLTAFKFMFRDEFEVMTALNTRAAETLLERHPDIDVVISDQRMPDETGVQFFDRLRARLSTTERIILTGHSDIDAVIAAINQAGVYFYLRKPWQEGEVRLVLRNALDSVRMHKDLLQQAETMQVIEENVTDVISRTDVEGRYIYISPSIQTVCGFAQEDMIGHHVDEFMHPDDARNRLDMQRRCLNGRNQKMIYRFRHKLGHFLWIEASLQGVRGANEKIDEIITVSRDITARRAAEERVEFLAYHDVLTELPNRLLISRRLQEAMDKANREQSKAALLFLDLDNFKTINDSLGHSVGDQLLKAVANRLTGCVRPCDTISRQGGDEFLILMPDLAHAEVATGLMDTILIAMQTPFRIGDHELMTTLSIGTSVYPDDGTDFDSLLKKADTAMYRAKDLGRNTYRFFDSQMNVEAVEHLTILNGLRRGIERGEFVLHYQPLIDLARESVIGAEALIRWQHPELGLLPPGRFIPVAENSGLIVPIGEWVLREACQQAAEWRTLGCERMLVAVNLSAVQFKRGNLERSVLAALQASGLPPSQLELELTESILIHDTEDVLATVKRLKALGIKLSIDDFGTGYSSLAYLKRFAVDKLKIDRSFTRDMIDDLEDNVIVRTIIQMAQSLGLRTIAEGVESEQMLTYLRLFDCDEAQGYHIARPMPAAEFMEFIAKRT